MIAIILVCLISSSKFIYFVADAEASTQGTVTVLVIEFNCFNLFYNLEILIV